MIFGIWLVLLGVLAVPSLVLSRRPDAASALAKLAPYQGWMGAVSLLWGIWGIISSVLTIGWLASWPILWGVQLLVSLVLAGLGLILGIGVLKTFIKDPTAQLKMDQTLARIAPFQGTLGIIAVVLGIFRVVASFIWTVA
jgi:hypothetical protein